jgi:hypothetical protein
MYQPINDKHGSGLRTRTKILIALFVLGIVFAAVFTPTYLLVNKNKDKHARCVLPEVADNPSAPHPERVEIVRVPLPPTAPSNDTGSCSLSINPNGTGCMDAGNFALQSGSFLPDGKHVVARLTFSGAPLPPSPSFIYSGDHIVILKVDGTVFSNGDSWKCITCGVPDSHAQGAQLDVLDYPQTFHDGMRLLVGVNVIDCSPFLLTDDECTPNATFIYPIHWSTSADGSGTGGSIRELRLHPDNNYLGFNSMVLTGTSVDQFGYVGRITFSPSPTSGTPLVPRYDITNVTCFSNPTPTSQVLYVNPKNSSELIFSPLAPSVGEFRGWSKDGQEVMWIGVPVESGNFDIMATNLSSGVTRRLTSNPGYTDPVDMSPDNKWIVVMDTRATDRMTFAAGMRGIPPLTDLATTATTASIRNNGDRRFFEPYLIDQYGDRGAYQGQLLTAEGDGSPGSINDPYWNGMADPRWAPDGTSVVFWQAFVTPPACGGINPLPCLNSTEPGQRRARVFIAKFPDRKPTPPYPIPPVPDTIPWATPYVPGSPPMHRPTIPNGTYVLRGRKSGYATCQITLTPQLTSVSANYTNYSDDGYFVIDGQEFASRNSTSPLVVQVFWQSNLTLSGCETGKKFTNPEGYFTTLDIMYPVVQSTGFLATTIGNTTYYSPNPGT